VADYTFEQRLLDSVNSQTHMLYALEPDRMLSIIHDYFCGRFDCCRSSFANRQAEYMLLTKPWRRQVDALTDYCAVKSSL